MPSSEAASQPSSVVADEAPALPLPPPPALPPNPGAPSSRPAVTTFAMLQDELTPLAPDQRAARCIGYAHARDNPLPERQKAVAHCARLARTDAQRLKASLVAAHVHLVAEAWGKRQGALQQAAFLARKLGDARAPALQKVVAIEPRLLSLQRQVEAAVKRNRQLQPAQVLAAGKVIELALPYYVQLHDASALVRVQFWPLRARQQSSKPPTPHDLLDVYERLLKLRPDDRDNRGLRQRIHRARVQLFIALDRWDEAVEASLRADRDTALRAGAEEQGVYSRTLATSQLCAQARDQAVGCAEVEQRLFGQVSSYDFSQEPPLKEFSEARALVALAEYDWLLQRCVKAAAKSGEVRGAHFTLEWPIGLNGKVATYDIKPHRYRDGRFARCLDEAFARIRYPRYQGEQQHTQLAFDVGE